MKKAVYLILTLALCLASVNVFAQWSAGEENPDSTQALGLHFGNVSGNGLSYRHFLPSVGFQAVLGGYSSGTDDINLPDYLDRHLEDTENTKIKTDHGRKYSINLGLNAIYPLKKTDLFMFYVTGGFCWKYFNEKKFEQEYQLSSTDTTRYDPVGEVKTVRDIENLLNMGFGPGAEIRLGKYFKLALEIPITYTGKHEFIMYVPQAGIYYYFK